MEKIWGRADDAEHIALTISQHSTAQHTMAQHSTAHHITTQHTMAHHNATHHGTAQHTMAHHNATHTIREYYLGDGEERGLKGKVRQHHCTYGAHALCVLHGRCSVAL